MKLLENIEIVAVASRDKAWTFHLGQVLPSNNQFVVDGGQLKASENVFVKIKLT